jgi:hypothetical protein
MGAGEDSELALVADSKLCEEEAYLEQRRVLFRSTSEIGQHLIHWPKRQIFEHKRLRLF